MVNIVQKIINNINTLKNTNDEMFKIISSYRTYKNITDIIDITDTNNTDTNNTDTNNIVIKLKTEDDCCYLKFINFTSGSQIIIFNTSKIENSTEDFPFFIYKRDLYFSIPKIFENQENTLKINDKNYQIINNIPPVIQSIMLVQDTNKIIIVGKNLFSWCVVIVTKVIKIYDNEEKSFIGPGYNPDNNNTKFELDTTNYLNLNSNITINIEIFNNGITTHIHKIINTFNQSLNDF